MNVPPFIPQQIEVGGNVAIERYPVRVGFLRRVVGLHAAYWGLVLAIALIPLSTPSGIALGVLAGSLLCLSLVRNLAKGWRHEQLLSAVCVPFLTWGLAASIDLAVQSGWPFWVFGLGPLASLGYILFCGKDVSFLGMFFLTTIGVSVVVALATTLGWLTPARGIETGLALVAYQFYFVYDLAALQTRRRLGEEFGAMLDLFRDVLNFTTYPIRVIIHWRRHRIWSRG